jgi:hypothetical protein
MADIWHLDSLHIYEQLQSAIAIITSFKHVKLISFNMKKV